MRNSSPSAGSAAVGVGGVTGTRSAPGRARPVARVDARRRRISSSWPCAMACWVNSVAWMPWNSPSSQPTSCACASAQLRLGRRRRSVNGSTTSSSSCWRSGESTLFELVRATSRGSPAARRRPASSSGARRTSSSIVRTIDAMRISLVGLVICSPAASSASARGPRRSAPSAPGARASTSSGCTRSRRAGPSVPSCMAPRIGGVGPVPLGTAIIEAVNRGGRGSAAPGDSGPERRRVSRAPSGDHLGDQRDHRLGGRRRLLEPEQPACARQEVGHEGRDSEQHADGGGGEHQAVDSGSRARAPRRSRRAAMRVERERPADGEPRDRLGRDAAVAAAEVEVEVHPAAHEHRGGAERAGRVVRLMRFMSPRSCRSCSCGCRRSTRTCRARRW